MKPAAAKIKQWREDPVSFVKEQFGVVPDAWQERALRAFPLEQRIAIKANKGPGKSALDAWFAWNFLLTRPHPKVAATSVSGDNLRDGLWTEMAKWQSKSKLLKELFNWNAERITSKHYPETWWMAARTWSKAADPSQQANTLAGLHADYILFLIDEAGDVPDSVVAAAEAALATGKETKLVITGNPTQTDGPLYRAFTRERELWFLVEVTGDPDDPNRSPRVSLEWARQQIEKYGRHHPYVIVNVFGQFPPTASNALLGIEDVSSAARRTIGEADYIYDAKIMGVDVARFGDDRSVIFLRQGRMALRPKMFRNLDTMELAGQVALAITASKPDAVFIDATGLGAGVVDRCHQLGLRVQGVDFGSRPLRSEPKLANRRTEMWWQMAEWVRSGGCIPDDGELISELTAPTYFFRDAGISLEKKEDIKKRGLPSPDKADALALTFALPVVAPAVSNIRNQEHTRHEYDPFTRAGAMPIDYQPAAVDYDPFGVR